jgi:hypothetical protein
MHTLFTDELIKISLQSNEHLEALVDLIKDKSNSGESLKTHVFSLMCELVWINSNILFLLRRDFQEPVFKGTDQKEVLVSEQTLVALTSLLMSGSQASADLNKLSYSICLH